MQAALLAVAKTLPDVGIVSTNTFPLDTDELHFNDVGQVDLGSGFAAQMEQVLPEPSTGTLLLGSLALLGLIVRQRQLN